MCLLRCLCVVGVLMVVVVVVVVVVMLFCVVARSGVAAAADRAVVFVFGVVMCMLSVSSLCMKMPQ